MKTRLFVIACLAGFVAGQISIRAYAEFVSPYPWKLDTKQWASIGSKALTRGIPVLYLQNKKFPELKLAYTRLQFSDELSCLNAHPCEKARFSLRSVKPKDLKISHFRSKSVRSCEIQYEASGRGFEKFYLYQSHSQSSPRTCSVDTFVWGGDRKVLADQEKKAALENLFALIRSSVDGGSTR